MKNGVYIGEEVKVCSSCGICKPLEQFGVDRHARFGRRHKCKNCYKERYNREKEDIAAYAKSWRESNKVKSREYVRYSGYRLLGLSITPEECESLYNKQQGKCAICSDKSEDSEKHLCLDHCHKTMKVRGFLCFRCNRGLGSFKDDRLSIENAIAYLSTPRQLSVSDSFDAFHQLPKKERYSISSIVSFFRKKGVEMDKYQYYGLYLAHSKLCDICGLPESSSSGLKLNLDHDHVTKRLRGFLCKNCNLGLGQFRDRIDFLQEALCYLNG